MLNIICWTLLVVFGFLYVMCMFGPIVTVKEESKNSYILLFCLFFTLICIFPLKELYSPLVASRMWQISAHPTNPVGGGRTDANPKLLLSDT